MKKKSIPIISVILTFLFFSAVIILNVRSETAVERLNSGRNYFEEGEYDKAIAQFKKALELEPGDADIHFVLGFAYHMSARLEEAIAQYKKVISLDPDNAHAYSKLGYVYGLLEQPELELKYLKKAKRLFMEQGDLTNFKRIDKYLHYLEFEKYLGGEEEKK